MSRSNPFFYKTRRAVIGSSILLEPLLTIYSLLAFIMRKDLHATAFQISVLMMLKPVVSIFSLYWSHAINDRRDKLLSNVFWAGVLGRAPFLFFPFVENIWLIIACAAFHMMMYRGAGPAWMEILKLNLPSEERGRIFSLGAVLGYIEGIVLAIGMGLLLDYDSRLWRWIFPASALLGIMGVFLQSQVPIDLEKAPVVYRPRDKLGFLEGASIWRKIAAPWKDSLNLMFRRPDFFRFQMGFMLCGFGIMLVQPVLPILFSDILHLSYTEMMLSLSVCKGIGYALSSSIWAQMINKINIYRVSSIIFLILGLYISLLICSTLHVSMIYAAYLCYGVVLAGNHLSWNLSGPIFAKEEDSSIFSSVNVVTVGLRGCVAPPLGGFLSVFMGPIAVLGIGFFLFLYSGIQMFFWGRSFIEKRSISDNL